MWWLYFLLGATVAESASLSILNSDNVTALDDLSENEDWNFLKGELDKIADGYLEYFSEAQSQPVKREKRQVSSTSKSSLLVDKTGAYRLQILKPILNMCSPALKIEFIDIVNDTYAVCISAEINNIPATVHLGIITNLVWLEIHSWAVSNPVDLALLYDGGILNVLVADNGRVDGIDLARYNLITTNIVMNHVIDGKYPTSVAVWKMKKDNIYHMAMAHSEGNKDLPDLSTKIFTYHWMGTYFDKYGMIIGYDVKDIEPFHIYGASYLAVANFRRGKDDFKVDSEIFKYSLNDRVYLSYQKIRTHQAMDFEFFTLGQGTGQESFLAVANYAQSNIRNVSSVIYKFVKDIFVPFQCLETYGATSIAALTDEQKFLLAIANEDILHLYQYDGWRFVRASIQYTQRLSYGVNDLSFHLTLGESKTSILAISNSDSRYMFEPSLFEVVFVHEKSLETWYEESNTWCQNKLDYLNNPAVTGLEDLKDVVFVDQESPIVIHGNLSFTAGLEAAQVTTPEFIDTTSNIVYDNSILLKLKDLNQRIQAASKRIQMIQAVFNKAIKLEGEQEVTAHYEFHDITLQCEKRSCVFTNVTTTILNGEDVSNLKENLIFLDEDQVIPDTLSVENIKANEIIVDGLVDGMNMSNVVTKSGNREITAPKIFKKTLHSPELEVGGLVDGVKISPQTVLLRTGYQNITGDISFTNLNTRWLEIAGLVNGQDLNEFYHDVVLTTGNYVITGEKTFHDISIENLELAPGSKINDVDVSDLYHNTLWKAGDQEITAPITFSSVTFRKHVFCDNINGIKIPGSEIVLLDDDAKLTVPQTFLQTTFIPQLNIGNSINGILVDKETGELDILLKTGHQTITGNKTFNTIVLGRDSFVGGTIDDVDLQQFYAASIRRDSSVKSSHTWTFNNLIVKGPLNVKGSVSGVNINEIYQNAVKLNETYLPNFIFEGGVYIEDLESHNINGIDVSNDLIQINKKQVITGKKSFKKVILQQHSTVTGLVNDIDMSFFSDTVLRVGNQNITSTKIFNGDVTIGKLSVNGKINGASFGDLMTTHGNQVVTGIKTFTNLKANMMDVNNMEVSGLINNVDINEMVKDTMTYDGIQTVTGTKTITGTLRVANGSNLQTNSLNGIDISSVWEDAVLVDKPQNISGHKTFASVVTFENLWVKGSVDDVTMEIMNDWMLQDVEQIVSGNVQFDNLMANDVVVNGLVNGINITYLNQTMVKTNETSFIEGPVVFAGTVHSAGDIMLSGKIGGIDLSEEAVLTTKENVITGLKTFEGDITIQRNLFVGGLIDNVSIKELCDNAILLDQENGIEGLIVDGNVTFENGVTVTGHIAGVNITSLNMAAVKSEDSETHVSGMKVFDSLRVEGNLMVKGKFGGIDIKDLYDNYMSLSREQEIKVVHRFEELDVKGSIHANNFYTSDQKINGVDLKELNETVLRTTGFQEVGANYNFDEVIFDDLVVVGKVNGIEIPKGVMKRNRTNYINSPKTFLQNVHVLGDLEMDAGRKIQDVDLSRWASKVVKKNYGTYRVGGFKTFTNLTTQDMIVEGLIDGVKISKDNVLLSYGDQEITGKKIIAGNVDVYGDLAVGGLINNVNLVDLANRAILKDRNNTISALKTFKKPLTIHSLQANSVNGINILDVQKKINFVLDFDMLSNRFMELEGAIEEMKIAINKQAVILQYHELFQSFPTATGYSWLYISTADKEYLLLSDFAESYNECTSIQVYAYDEVENNFQLDQKLISSNAIAMRSIQAWNTTLLIIANAKPKPNCFGPEAKAEMDEETGYVDDGDTIINIYYYLLESSSFEVYQSLMGRSAADVMAFVGSSALCFVYLEMVDTKVFCAYDSLHPFQYVETLRTTGGRKATIISHDGMIMLAIASTDAVEQSVDIYQWHDNQSTFDEPIQVIRSTQAESVLFMKHVDNYSTEIFLIIAEGTIPRINNVPRLFVYKYRRSLVSFFKYQEIKDSGQLDWTTMPTGELVFFVLDDITRKIKYYRYKGSAGFVLSDSIDSVGTQTLHVFKRNSPEDKMNHYLALAGVQSTAPHVWSDPYPAKVLKSKMKGERIPAPPLY